QSSSPPSHNDSATFLNAPVAKNSLVRHATSEPSTRTFANTSLPSPVVTSCTPSRGACNKLGRAPILKCNHGSNAHADETPNTATTKTPAANSRIPKRRIIIYPPSRDGACAASHTGPASSRGPSCTSPASHAPP